MIKNAFTKTQIDRLGERLKGGLHTEGDLRLLDDYRRSFREANEAVIRAISEIGEFPTVRRAKSTPSIVGKLRREKSMHLSQMQDIAGCRVVVANIVDQEQFVASLRTAFPEASVIDRRDKPSYGYRAVHIIAKIAGKPVEIQVRTALQHMWAELSEKSSDVLDPTIKYGGGAGSWRTFLLKMSQSVAAYEEFEKKYSKGVAAYEEIEKEYSKAVAAYEEIEKKYSKAVAAHERVEKAVAELPEHHPPVHEVQELREKLEDLIRKTVRLKQSVEELRGEMASTKQKIEELRGKMAPIKQTMEELRREKVRLWNVNADRLKKMISWLDERRLKGLKR